MYPLRLLGEKGADLAGCNLLLARNARACALVKFKLRRGELQAWLFVQFQHGNMGISD